MKINQKLYDVLKYLALVGLPAVASFIMVVGASSVWDWSHVDQIVKTIVAFDTLLGALLLINSAQYTKDQKTTALLTDTHPNDVAPVTDPVVEAQAVVATPAAAAVPADPSQPSAGVPPTPSQAIKKQ
jgi:hypothetical protein